MTEDDLYRLGYNLYVSTIDGPYVRYKEQIIIKDITFDNWAHVCKKHYLESRSNKWKKL